MVAIQSQQSDHKLQDRFRLYLLLQHYYTGQTLNWNLQDWQEATAYLAGYISASYQEIIESGVRLLQGIQPNDLSELEFEFNRLFVGPDMLLASPYESSYRSLEKTLMQTETLQVREFYRRAGLEVTNIGIEPDDHLAFELEFICYLLANAEEQGFNRLFGEFLHEHLLVWYEEHCVLIHKSSEHPITRGMAYILEGFMEQEKAWLNSNKEGSESHD